MVQHVNSTGDDDCVGNECSDIEAELMRRGGLRVLIVRERVICPQEVDICQGIVNRSNLLK